MHLCLKLFLLGLTSLTGQLQAADLKPASDFPSSGFFEPVKQSELDFGYSAKVVIGPADFEKMRDFPQTSDLYKLSERIGAVFMDGRPMCSGSLVGPDLFLTNEHCAFSGGKQIPLSKYLFSFNYYVDDLRKVSGMPLFKATELVAYNAKLDYALFRLDQPVGDKLGWLTLETNDKATMRANGVRIIQHPKGRSKEVVLKNTGLYKEFLNRGLVHYFADTEPGSSGSPVFTATGDSIIALHHSGYTDNEGKAMINEGISAARIYAEINRFLPASKRDRRANPRTQQPVHPPAQPADGNARSRRTAPVSPRPPAPRQTQPAPAQPAKPSPQRAQPKVVDCKGQGMAVTDENGNVTCVEW